MTVEQAVWLAMLPTQDSTHAPWNHVAIPVSGPVRYGLHVWVEGPIRIAQWPMDLAGLDLTRSLIASP